MIDKRNFFFLTGLCPELQELFSYTMHTDVLPFPSKSPRLLHPGRETTRSSRDSPSLDIEYVRRGSDLSTRMVYLFLLFLAVYF